MTTETKKPNRDEYKSYADYRIALEHWLENQEGVEILDGEEDWEDTYDSQGRPCPGGMYDAGGHIISDRMADYCDYLYDRFKDEGY